MIIKIKGKIMITYPAAYPLIFLKIIRNCNFKGIDKNFPESIWMMDDDELDFYGWPLKLSYANLLIHNHNFEISKVASIYSLHIGQILRKPNKLKKSDFSLFLIENIRILVIILIGFALTLAAKFTLLKIIKRRCSLYHLSTIKTRLDSVSFKIGVLSLAFSFFLFFNLNILTNMIKTQKVTVNTSEFINSISTLYKTTKPLVTWDPNSTNLFNQLFKKRKQRNDLIRFDYDHFDDFISVITKNGFDSNLYFMDEFHFLFLVHHFALLNRSADHFAFIKPTIYFESLKAIFYRKNLDQKMKKILNYR